MKNFTRAFLPLFFLWTVFLPARAYAFVPLVLAGARIASVAFKTPLGQDIAIGTAIGIGAIIAQLSIQRNSASGVGTETSTLYYTNTPRPPSAAEAAAGFTAGYPSLTPAPTAGAPVKLYRGGFHTTITGSTGAAVCQVLMVYYAGSTSFAVMGETANAFGCQMYKADGSGNGGESGTISNSCSAGYATSGVTCVLSNAAAVPRPADGFCPIVRSGNTYAQDSTDSDCVAGVSPSFAADGSWSISSADGVTVSGQRTGVVGQEKVTYSKPDPVTNTTNITNYYLQQGATAADSSVVTGVSTSVGQGTGTAFNSASSVAAADPAFAAAVSANTVAVQAVQGEVAAVGEANTVATSNITAAAGLTASYAQQSTDLTNRSNGLGLPALPAFLFPSFVPATCAPISWTFQNRVISYDLCPWVPAIKRIEAWTLNLISAAICFSMLMNFRAMRLRS